jgi:hypothetical protein
VTAQRRAEESAPAITPGVDITRDAARVLAALQLMLHDLAERVQKWLQAAEASSVQNRVARASWVFAVARLLRCYHESKSAC